MPKFIFLCIIIVLFVKSSTAENSMYDEADDFTRHHKRGSHDHSFDVLIFTQQWPAVFCFEWMNKNPNHACQLPSPKKIWTIHGIWPTKYGTLGPFNCNSSAEFDPNQVQSIRSELDQFWINIEKGTPFDNLWRHEWDKHGTCAAQLDTLSNENKYFGQGLSWLHKYSMTSILDAAGIAPGTETWVATIHQAVTNALGIQPVIHCVHDSHDNKNYLSEIRICFNKTLSLVDCDGVVGTITMSYPEGKVITNCDITQPIYYPTNVPPTQFTRDTKPEWKFPFVNTYKLIQLIKWFTL